MTRNNTTSYREKGRALFLAVIMVVSVVAMSAAFAGAGAATQPAQEDAENLDDDAWWQGQSVNVTHSDIDGTTDTVQLRSVSDTEDGDVESSSLAKELSVKESGGTYYIDLDTDDLEGDYALRVGGEFINDGDDDIVFEVAVQDLDAEWDETSVSTGDDDVELELDSVRANYNVSITADDLDYDQLKELFAETDDAVAIEDDDDGSLPIDKFFDRDDNDDFDDLKDDDILTLDMSDVDDQTLIGNFTNLEEEEGVDAGEYEFEVFVTDTTAEDTASITVEDEDVTLDFQESTTQQTAGDIVEFTVEMEDTTDGYVAIGDEDVNYLDILYIEDSDDEGEVTFTMNTRYAGLVGDQNEYVDYDDDDVFNAEDGDVTHVDYSAGIDDADEANSVEFVNDDGDHISDVTSATTLGDVAFDELDISNLTRPLQPDSYELATSNDGVFVVNDDDEFEVDDEEDIATLTLSQPGLDDATVHVAPEDDADGDDYEDLAEHMTERYDVALDDRMVVEVEATGLYGALYGPNSDVDFEDDHGEALPANTLDNLTGEGDIDEGLDLEIVQNNVQGNIDPITLLPEDYDEGDIEDVALYADNDAGVFHLVVNTDGDLDTERDLADGQEFDVDVELEGVDGDFADRYSYKEAADNGDALENIRVSGSPYLSGDETQEVTKTVTFEDREATWDDLNDNDVLEVSNDDEVTVSGETNIAPNTEITNRNRATGDNPFLKSSDIEVTSDGEWSSTIDFSDANEDQEFTSSIRLGGSTIDEVDGIVGEEEETAEAELSWDVDVDPAAPEEGDDVDVTVSAENLGDETSDSSYEFIFADETQLEGDVELEGGDSDSWSFTVEDAEAGDYEWELNVDDDVESSGTLTVSEATDDDDEMTDEDADDEADDDEVTEEEADDDADDDGTPGFGAAVAAVALLAAAMLALRRQN